MVRIMDTVILCVFALLTVVIDDANAYMWNWMWSGTHPQGRAPPEMVNDGPVNNGDLEREHPRNIQARLLLNETEARYYQDLPCDSDKMCGRGRFCDLHYGGCHRHRQPGHQCRRDGHCQKGHDCMFGTCRATIPERTLGARCRNNKDCSHNMCCAKQHGESVCKQKLPLQAKCFIPPGGIEYVIDTMCPCEEGLVCSETVVMEKREQEFVLRFWTDEGHMRCQAR
ncbi:dickkopf-related protein 3 [Strongylocentrotus purpuratus]|uniref:Dickkopf N-terminal cysteine-rich domain-containing protein n=1 Tax=Strongylocentrotus purpuratus TaxID=7668 RepID=A0A7M7RFS9_STRPU|nr:dickkopf-related protein 3 [Strongylocentrotus purpuratus]|eukprot:XP_800228.1 PREDICTED: dickkopf-related protein 3 [Strongylocentrotus purpuratus]